MVAPTHAFGATLPAMCAVTTLVAPDVPPTVDAFPRHVGPAFGFPDKSIGPINRQRKSTSPRLSGEPRDAKRVSNILAALPSVDAGRRGSSSG